MNQRVLAVALAVVILLAAAGGLVAAGALRPGHNSPTPSSSPGAAPTQALEVQSSPTIAAGPTTTIPEIASPAAPGGSSVERDVTYCTAGDVPLLMDVYEPQPASGGPVPVIVYVHGGGWTSGDKSAASMWAGLLTRRGYLVASINYRLAPDYKWPAQIEDAKCSVRYLRANAARYNLDPKRIGAMGDSAGGHLVSLMGLAGPEAGWDKSGGYSDRSSAVQAVVDMYGPTDFTSINVKENRALIGQLMGMPYDQAAEVLRKASPVTYVHAGAPPFLIIQGEEDQLVPPRQSEMLNDRLKAAGVPVSLVMVKNSGHAFQPVGGQLQPTLLEISQMIARFFDSHLK